MVWVKRTAGIVTAIFHSSQPGVAEEQLPDSHPDVVAFKAERTLSRIPEERMRRTIGSDPFRKAVVKLMAADRGISIQEMVQLLTDQLRN